MSDVETTVLGNGIKVITRQISGIAASVGAFVNVGSRHELEDESGAAHFLEHMAFKGTQSRTAFDISHEIEVLGADMNANTSNCTTAYFVTGLAEHVPIAIDIIGDALGNSKFDQADIDLERGVICQEIAQYEDDPASTMFDLLGTVAYPDHPVGRPILGSRDFINGATTESFREFINRNYSGETMMVVAAGTLEHQTVVDAAAKAFANVPVSGRMPVATTPVYTGGLRIDRSKDFSQAAIGIMFQSVPYCDNARLSHMLLSYAFGRGMSSPLFTEIREKRGLVYSTSAYSEFERDYGYVAFYGLLTPGNLSEFIKVSCAEFIKMTETVDESDLDRARNTILVRLALQETSPSIVHNIADRVFLTGDVPDMNEIYSRVKAVTIDDLKAAAKRLVVSKPSIAIVGPVPESDYEGMVASALGRLS